MSDVRCPMCGKPNPADAVICQYCLARLKPLVKPPENPPEPQKGKDEVDWLRGLASADSQPAGSPEEDAVETPPEDMPDWLARIRQKTQEEEDAVSPIGRPPVIETHPENPPATENTPSETPDWLEGLRPPAAPSGGSNWLDSLRGAGLPEEPPAQPEAPVPPSTEDIDNDEWLRSFNARVGTGSLESPKEEKKETPPVPAVPAAPQAGEPPRPPQAPVDMPDWLKNFNFEQPESAPTAPTGGPASPAPEGEAAPAEGIPDWLKSFGVEQPAAQAPAEPAAAGPAEEQAAPAEEMPEWLKTFGVEQPAAQAPAEPAAAGPAGGQAAPAEEVPEWLKSFGVQQPVDQSTAEPAAMEAAPESKAAPAEEVPDWLKSFAAEQPAAQIPTEAVAQAAPVEGEAAPAEEVPDWLKAFATEQPAAQAPAEPAAAEPQGEGTPVEGEAAPAEEVPDWLKAFSAAPAPIAGSVPAMLPEEGAVPAGEEAPDWMKTYAQQQGQPAEASAAPAEEPKFVSPFGEETLPEWMKSEQPAEAAAAAEPAAGLIGRSEEELSAAAHPFASEDMAQWLEQAQEETAVQGAGTGEGAPEGLEKAQLPAWLQAMRPVESAAPASVVGVDNDRVEKSGPLAGLRGILRVEDLVGQYQKPPVYTVKLRVSESQTVRTGLMEQILGEETNVQPPVAAPAQVSQWLVRVATALALIALLLIVLNYGPRPLVPAALSQVDPQVSAINRLVNNLHPDDPVLVGIDYQSGLQGELRVAAQPLLEHLMHQGTRLVFVSTNPAGPVLAQSLFNAAQAAGNTGYPVEFMANLGYLVGGSTGLQALAAPLDSQANPNPLQQALPLTYSPSGSWNLPALYGVKQLTDFKQVILLTDSVEGGRDWVEQVRPALAKANIPLIVISSAQSAPLLLPYEASGQITAMLGGLPGGAAYEQIRQSRGDGTTFWNAYLAGILAATLFILLGGVVSLISNLAHPKSNLKA